MADDKPLILVDGSSYLFRAFHALPPLTTSEGRPTGAIRGVVAMLRKLMSDHPGSPVVVVFDAKGDTFRNELYPEYKANRPPMPDDLRAQIEPLHEIVDAMGLPRLVIDGVEADDVIGTLAKRSSGERPVLVSTSDKDLAQLVTDRVTLVNTMSETTMDPAGVVEKFGVPPERIIDYLALVGDTVDNIPGVEKCGPKTAAKWLDKYGDLDTLMAKADEVGGKIGENLRAALDRLPLSRDLATIRVDLDLGLPEDALEPKAPDEAALLRWFRDLEFKSWISEASEKVNDDPPPPADYETVTDRAAFDAWLERLKTAELFAFDTETTSLHYMQAELVGVSFAVEPGSAAYVPFGHAYMGAPDQLDRDEVLEALRPLLEDENRAKVGQNLKYDMSVLARAGITLRGVRFDTMLESYVLDSVGTRHNMDDLALRFLGRGTIHFEDIAGRGRNQLTFDQIALEEAGPYAAEDADVTLQLHEKLWPRLAGENRLKSVFEEIEMPLLPVLSRIERNGAYVDADMLAKQSAELAEKMEALKARAWEAAGGEFNLGSTKQLQEILYDRLGLPVIRKTPKGAPSTAEPVLSELAHDYELPRIIMDYRSVSKLKSTYTDTLPGQIDPTTKRIHTSYHQAVAATGRLSSSEPNLQNIPIRTPEGRRIRQAFVAPKGRIILAADYSQIELRIMAHLSGDAGLTRAFAEGLDVHRATAAEVFEAELDAVTDDQRRSAKAINFGLIYGMSAFGLAKQLGIERDAAQAYVGRYFERYPGVRAFMERTREQARDQGYVETVFGRRLYLPDIRARNPQVRAAAERTAINAPMQGTASDIIKRAMIALDQWLEEENVPAQMIMQVHDELVFEVREDVVEAVGARVRALMQGAADLAVPLLVDVGVGDNWDEAH
ncbi:MAG: DNA polymerase I [Pseudomonadales bacterium]|jgi:DNA polymerase-1|nr:DNA polymerase I [Pseudomonadales bacterium]